MYIMGFVTLGTTSIDIFHLSQKQRQKIIGSSVEGRDEKDHIPCYLIGQLGRNDSCEKNRLPGSVLLYESVSILKEAKSIVNGGDLFILECRPHYVR